MAGEALDKELPSLGSTGIPPLLVVLVGTILLAALLSLILAQAAKPEQKKDEGVRAPGKDMASPRRPLDLQNAWPADTTSEEFSSPRRRTMSPVRPETLPLLSEAGSEETTSPTIAAGDTPGVATSSARRRTPSPIRSTRPPQESMLADGKESGSLHRRHASPRRAEKPPKLETLNEVEPEVGDEEFGTPRRRPTFASPERQLAEESPHPRPETPDGDKSSRLMFGGVMEEPRGLEAATVREHQGQQGMTEDGCLEVALERGDGEAFGFAWNAGAHFKERLIIAGITPKSVCGSWAAQQKESGLPVIERGDELVQANGVTGYTGLKEVLNSARRVHLRFVRKASMSAAGSDSQKPAVAPLSLAERRRQQLAAPVEPSSSGSVSAPLATFRSESTTSTPRSIGSRGFQGEAVSAVSCRVKNTFIEVQMEGGDDEVAAKRRFTQSDPAKVRALLMEEEEEEASTKGSPKNSVEDKPISLSSEMLRLVEEEPRSPAENSAAAAATGDDESCSGDSAAEIVNEVARTKKPTRRGGRRARPRKQAAMLRRLAAEQQAAEEEQKQTEAPSPCLSCPHCGNALPERFVLKPEHGDSAAEAISSTAIESPKGGRRSLATPAHISKDGNEKDKFVDSETTALIGETVRIQGLVQAPEFNGKWGRVEAYDLKLQRYLVFVLQDGTGVPSMMTKLKREHLLQQPTLSIPLEQPKPAGKLLASKPAANRSSVPAEAPPAAQLNLQPVHLPQKPVSPLPQGTAAGTTVVSPNPAMPPPQGVASANGTVLSQKPVTPPPQGWPSLPSQMQPQRIDSWSPAPPPGHMAQVPPPASALGGPVLVSTSPGTLDARVAGMPRGRAIVASSPLSSSPLIPGVPSKVPFSIGSMADFEDSIAGAIQDTIAGLQS